MSLYGLKHALRAWHEKVDTYFFNNCFKWCRFNLNVYVKHFYDEIVIIVLYVDGLIIIGN